MGIVQLVLGQWDGSVCVKEKYGGASTKEEKHGSL